MMTLDDIRGALTLGRIELTVHALKRIVERNISQREIIEASENAIEIEDYPQDKYFPSCLLLGFTRNGRPLHLHVSRMQGESVRIITLYEPNPHEWGNNFRERK
jgi:hypothetical protein